MHRDLPHRVPMTQVLEPTAKPSPSSTDSLPPTSDAEDESAENANSSSASSHSSSNFPTSSEMPTGKSDARAPDLPDPSLLSAPPPLPSPAVAENDVHLESSAVVTPDAPVPTPDRPSSADTSTQPELMSSKAVESVSSSIPSSPLPEPSVLAGAHASHMSLSPEDMEYARSSTTFADADGKVALEEAFTQVAASVADEVSRSNELKDGLSSPTASSTLSLFTAVSAEADLPNAQPTAAGGSFEVIDGTTIMFDDPQEPSLDSSFKESPKEATGSGVPSTLSNSATIHPTSLADAKQTTSVEDSVATTTPGSHSEIKTAAPMASETPETPPPAAPEKMKLGAASVVEKSVGSSSATVAIDSESPAPIANSASPGQVAPSTVADDASAQRDLAGDENASNKSSPSKEPGPEDAPNTDADTVGDDEEEEEEEDMHLAEDPEAAERRRKLVQEHLDTHKDTNTEASQTDNESQSGLAHDHDNQQLPLEIQLDLDQEVNDTINELISSEGDNVLTQPNNADPLPLQDNSDDKNEETKPKQEQTSDVNESHDTLMDSQYLDQNDTTKNETDPESDEDRGGEETGHAESETSDTLQDDQGFLSGLIDLTGFGEAVSETPPMAESLQPSAVEMQDSPTTTVAQEAPKNLVEEPYVQSSSWMEDRSVDFSQPSVNQENWSGELTPSILPSASVDTMMGTTETPLVADRQVPVATVRPLEVEDPSANAFPHAEATTSPYDGSMATTDGVADVLPSTQEQPISRSTNEEMLPYQPAPTPDFLGGQGAGDIHFHDPNGPNSHLASGWPLELDTNDISFIHSLCGVGHSSLLQTLPSVILIDY
jgi:hypothetical protein